MRPRYSAPRHRVLNWLAPPFGGALEHYERLAGVDIDFEIDRRKDRVVPLLRRGGEDLKDGGARLGVLTGKNPQQRAALRFIRSFVDDNGGLTPALMDGARPAKHPDEFQSVETGHALAAR